MNDERKAEGKIILAEELRKPENHVLVNGIFTYLLYGMMTHDNYDDLSEEQAQSLPTMLGMISERFPGMLDELFANGTPKDFDLFFYCNDNTEGIIHSQGIVSDDIIKSMILTAFAATFRLWYDKITYDDIFAFFEDREHPELPDMNDSSIIFAWAQEHGIQCSDVRSLFENPGESELTADEEIEAYHALGDMCKVFDALVPVMVKEGIPQTFLDEKRLTCRSLFMMTQVFYPVIPPHVDMQAIINDDAKLQNMYKSFLETMAGKKLRQDLQTESPEEEAYFFKVFSFSITAAHYMNADGHGFFSQTGEEIYKEATNRMAKKHKGKK